MKAHVRYYLITYRTNLYLLYLPAALSMAGIELGLKSGLTEEQVCAVAPRAKGLALKICRPAPAPVEVVTQSNAILRALATARPDALLYGRTEFESAQVWKFSGRNGRFVRYFLYVDGVYLYQASY